MHSKSLIGNYCKIQRIIYVLFVACACFFYTLKMSYAADGHKLFVRNIFIESSGFNSDEARIRAINLGAKRVLYMLADSMGLANLDLDGDKYRDMSHVCYAISSRDEKVSKNGDYSAIVDYECSKMAVNMLMLNLAEGRSIGAVYNHLIIPIFRQKHIVKILSNDNEAIWLNLWNERRDILQQMNILYPNNQMYNEHKNFANEILSMSYDDMISTFPRYLFRDALIVVAEYFTDKIDGTTYLNVSVIKLDQFGEYKTIKRYNIYDKTQTNAIMNSAISDILKKYGYSDAGKNLLQSTNLDKDKVLSEIVVYTDIENENMLTMLKKKLSKIDKIKSFDIIKDTDYTFKVVLHTKYTLHELSKDFYKYYLSYYNADGVNRLMQIAEGI